MPYPLKSDLVVRLTIRRTHFHSSSTWLRDGSSAWLRDATMYELPAMWGRTGQLQSAKGCGREGVQLPRWQEHNAAQGKQVTLAKPRYRGTPV